MSYTFEEVRGVRIFGRVIAVVGSSESHSFCVCLFAVSVKLEILFRARMFVCVRRLFIFLLQPCVRYTVNSFRFVATRSKHTR